MCIRARDLPYSYSTMRSRLSVVNASDTRMLDITFTSPSAEEAAEVANEYAKVVSQYIADTMSTDKPNIMSVALVPSNPVSPNKTRNVMLGFMSVSYTHLYYKYVTPRRSQLQKYLYNSFA